jgi:hypothetical protein
MRSIGQSLSLCASTAPSPARPRSVSDSRGSLGSLDFTRSGRQDSEGVAGRILWWILSQYTERHRVDFSNKEIRLDRTVALPDISDNLEARLILLRRRLEDRCPFIHIVKTGRGRFRLNIDRPLTLHDLP